MSYQPKPTTGECSLCNTGFPLDERGNHIPTQSLGMIPVTRCKKLPKPTTGEWTVEGKAIWNDTQPVGVAESCKEAKLIADAHNAALAVERERLEKQWGREGIHVTLERLKRELAAEREKHRKEMEAVTMNTSDIETVQKLHSQLAAGQALLNQFIENGKLTTNSTARTRRSHSSSLPERKTRCPQ